MRDSREVHNAPRSGAMAAVNAMQSTGLVEEVFLGALRLASLILRSLG